MTETELTVAELVAREGGTWPRTEQPPRHLLDEAAEPELEREADVVEPPVSPAVSTRKPQRPTVDYLDGEMPALVRGYMRQ